MYTQALNAHTHKHTHWASEKEGKGETHKLFQYENRMWNALAARVYNQKV